MYLERERERDLCASSSIVVPFESFRTVLLLLNPISLLQVPSNFSIYELLEKTVIETNQFEEDKNVRLMSVLSL